MRRQLLLLLAPVFNRAKLDFEQGQVRILARGVPVISTLTLI
jgi:hypothetical protein